MINAEGKNDTALKALLMLLEVVMKIVQMLVGNMMKKTGNPPPNLKGKFPDQKI